MHALAYPYLRQDELETAAGLQLDALNRQIALLGENNLDTIRSMHILASTYIKQNLLDKARALEQQVVSARESILGESSPDTLWAKYILATIYQKQGQLDKARDLDRELSQNLSRGQRGPNLVEDIIPSLLGDIKRSRPGTFDFEILVSYEWAKTVRGATPEESSDGTRGSDREHIEPDTIDNFDNQIPMQDVFKLLVNSKCHDLTERINMSRCPTTPNAGGRFGDVWCGELQDETQVAIKCLRLHTTSDTSVKAIKVMITGTFTMTWLLNRGQRAARELYYWSKAEHKNVLKLFGVAMFRGRLAMISPWMPNGTLQVYIRNHPDVNRWDLVGNDVMGKARVSLIQLTGDMIKIHGDLKAVRVNILVSDAGQVKLSDFGNAILSDHSLGFTATTNIGGGTSRWMAPELLCGQDIAGNKADRSAPADVFALGMTILVGRADTGTKGCNALIPVQEVVTGHIPYVEHKSEPYATLAVVMGILPQRPVQLLSDTRFGDERWKLLNECWKMEPKLRPKARNLLERVSGMAPG
ncbi:hypothetical protein FRC10_010213 [Ceratobasidium sp. 414]|nr:hypothetical protein FRC10_010213 [Ceratobasidium sp. 414]